MSATARKSLAAAVVIALFLQAFCALGITQQAFGATLTDLVQMAIPTRSGTLSSQTVYPIFSEGYAIVESVYNADTEDKAYYSDIIGTDGQVILKSSSTVGYTKISGADGLILSYSGSIVTDDEKYGLYKADGTVIAKQGTYDCYNTIYGEHYVAFSKVTNGAMSLDFYNAQGTRVVSGTLSGVSTESARFYVVKYTSSGALISMLGNYYWLDIEGGKITRTVKAFLADPANRTATRYVYKTSTGALRIVNMSTGKVLKMGSIGSVYDKSTESYCNNSWICFGTTTWGDASTDYARIFSGRYYSQVTGKAYTAPSGCTVVGLYGSSFILVKKTGTTASATKYYVVNGKGETVQTVAARTYVDSNGKRQYPEFKLQDGAAYYQKDDGTKRAYSIDFSKYRDLSSSSYRTGNTWTDYITGDGSYTCITYNNSLEEISRNTYSTGGRNYGMMPMGTDPSGNRVYSKVTGSQGQGGDLYKFADDTVAKIGKWSMGAGPSGLSGNNDLLGIYYVMNSDNLLGAVDAKGNIKLDCVYQDIADLNDGTSMVAVKKNGKWYIASLYSAVKPATTSVASLTSPAAGQLKVTWTAKDSAAKATGYQLRYSTSSGMTSASTVNVSGYKTASKTLTGKTSGKTYYVQIRTVYKAANGKTYYSAWSAKKSVAVK